MKRFLMTCVMFIALGASWSVNSTETGNELTAADSVAIHAVVQLQLDALAEDDAASAFDQATPARRMQIGTPDNFLRIIREQFNPVYRHQAAIFSKPRLVDGTAIQIVRLTDRESAVWVAVFKMERDENRSWKIDGCQLFQTTSISV